MQNLDPVGICIHSAYTPGDPCFLTMGLSAACTVWQLLAFSLLQCFPPKQQTDFFFLNKNSTIAEEKGKWELAECLWSFSS